MLSPAQLCLLTTVLLSVITYTTRAWCLSWSGQGGQALGIFHFVALEAQVSIISCRRYCNGKSWPDALSNSCHSYMPEQPSSTTSSRRSTCSRGSYGSEAQPILHGSRWPEAALWWTASQKRACAPAGCPALFPAVSKTSGFPSLPWPPWRLLGPGPGL